MNGGGKIQVIFQHKKWDKIGQRVRIWSRSEKIKDVKAGLLIVFYCNISIYTTH